MDLKVKVILHIVKRNERWKRVKVDVRMYRYIEEFLPMRTWSSIGEVVGGVVGPCS